MESALTTPDGKPCSNHIALRKLLPSKDKTPTNSFKVDTKLITYLLQISNKFDEYFSTMTNVFMTLIANPGTTTLMIPSPLRVILSPCNLFPRTMLPQ